MRQLLQVPTYVVVGLFATLSAPLSLPIWGGGLILLVVAVWLWVRRPWPDRWLVPVALGAASVLLFLLVAPGRVGFGIEQARSSRYVYLAWAMALPLIGAMVSNLTRSRVLRGLVLAGIVLAAIAGYRTLAEFADGEAAREREIRTAILAAAALLGEGEQVVPGRPEPSFSRDLTVARLRALLERGSLPPPPKPSPAARVTAAARVQVALTAEPLFPIQGPRVDVSSWRCEHRTQGRSVLVLPASPLSLPVALLVARRSRSISSRRMARAPLARFG